MPSPWAPEASSTTVKGGASERGVDREHDTESAQPISKQARGQLQAGYLRRSDEGREALDARVHARSAKRNTPFSSSPHNLIGTIPTPAKTKFLHTSRRTDEPSTWLPRCGRPARLANGYARVDPTTFTHFHSSFFAARRRDASRPAARLT
jgi:hypothetical protein